MKKTFKKEEGKLALELTLEFPDAEEHKIEDLFSRLERIGWLIVSEIEVNKCCLEAGLIGMPKLEWNISVELRPGDAGDQWGFIQEIAEITVDLYYDRDLRLKYMLENLTNASKYGAEAERNERAARMLMFTMFALWIEKEDGKDFLQAVIKEVKDMLGRMLAKNADETEREAARTAITAIKKAKDRSKMIELTSTMIDRQTALNMLLDLI